VQERLRQQKQRSKSAEPAATELAQPATGGKLQAVNSAAAVSTVLEEAQAAANAVNAAAAERISKHTEACEAEEAALRTQGAQQAVASRHENQVIDLEWERLQVGA
jgi:ActR/RegA family two-component response regulator